MADQDNGGFIEEIQPVNDEPETIDTNTSDRNRPEDDPDKQKKDKEAKENERKLFLYRLLLLILTIIIAAGVVYYVVLGIGAIYRSIKSGITDITVSSPLAVTPNQNYTTQLPDTDNTPGPVKSNINVVPVSSNEQVAQDQTELSLAARIALFRNQEIHY
jgi:flagellar basal body-associated protein FliL